MSDGPLPPSASASADIRYSDAEVTEILRLATEGESAGGRPVPPVPNPSPEGLALAELRRIGDEVGIAPDQLIAAARLVHAERLMVQRTEPHTFHLTASLPVAAPMSEEHWGRIVVVLRETFEDTGVVTHEGALRQWRSTDHDQQNVSRLEARLEPDPHGQGWRLLLTSRTVDHTMSVGAFLAALGVVVAAIPLGSGLPPKVALLGAAVVACGGMVLVGGYRWRQTWRQQRWQRFRRALAGLLTLELHHLPSSREAAEPEA